MTPVPPEAKLRDAIDREHLEQMLQTRGYAILRARMKAAFDGQLEELRKDLSPEMTAKARGVLNGIQLCHNLPNILCKEFDEKDQ